MYPCFAFGVEGFSRQDQKAMRAARILRDFFEWRWAPCVALTVGSLAYVGLAVLLMAAYGLGLLFSLKTHKELFASEDHDEAIAATGFVTPLQDLPALGVTTFGASRLPVQTPWWESATPSRAVVRSPGVLTRSSGTGRAARCRRVPRR